MASAPLRSLLGKSAQPAYRVPNDSPFPIKNRSMVGADCVSITAIAEAGAQATIRLAPPEMDQNALGQDKRSGTPRPVCGVCTWFETAREDAATCRQSGKLVGKSTEFACRARSVALEHADSRRSKQTSARTVGSLATLARRVALAIRPSSGARGTAESASQSMRQVCRTGGVREVVVSGDDPGRPLAQPNSRIEKPGSEECGSCKGWGSMLLSGGHPGVAPAHNRAPVYTTSFIHTYAQPFHRLGV